MKSQKGAALVVVLSMLTMSLMLGLSGMQSSLVEERLAGNYKAATEAQMRAEHAVATLYADIADSSVDKVARGDVENHDWGSSGFRWSSFKGFAKNSFSDSCDVSELVYQIACYMELPENFYRNGITEGDYIVAIGAVDDADVAESEPVFVRLDEGSIVSTPEAALSCVGPSCQFLANNKPTLIDGRDYKESVDTKGKVKEEDINTDGEDRAAYIVSDNDSPGDVDIGKATVEGEEINSADSYESYEKRGNDKWSDAQSQIESDIDTLIELGKNDDPRITYVDSSTNMEEFIMPSSGIVVVNGTDLFIKNEGSFKFSGLIAVKDGGAYFHNDKGKGGGTVAVVGAVIARNSKIGMGNGNPSLLYSSEALGMVGATSGNGGGSTSPIIKSWR